MPSIEFGAPEVGWARDALYDTLDELCGLSRQIPLNLLDYGIHFPVIELLGSSNLNQYNDWPVESRKEDWEILIIDLNIAFSLEILASAEDGLLPIGAHKCMIQHYLIKRVSDILLAANIACPGSIELASSIVVQDGEVQVYSQVPTMDGFVLQEGIELANSVGWPIVRRLQFEQVWSWLGCKDLITDGFDTGATGRALAAFSRTFEQERIDAAMKLVWTMIGIEALYVKGKASVVEQVREKILSFLGSHPSNKKRISQTYETRSRFIHGDLAFPGIYLLADATDASHRYNKQHSDAVNLASAILVSTLQELIHRGWIELEFSYIESAPAI